MERTASLQRTLGVVGFLVTALLLNTRTVLADDEVIGGPEEDRLATLNYWTPERMKDTENKNPRDDGVRPREKFITPDGDDAGHAKVLKPYRNNFISKVTGDLFFYDPVNQKNSHCSASIVTSKSKRLLVTAAHCLVAATEKPPLQWNQYPMFVPAYDVSQPEAQRAPYGFWPIQRSYVSAVFEERPLEGILRAELDLAVAGVFVQQGRLIEDVVGGGFTPYVNDDHDHIPLVNMVGYPGVSRYSGLVQYWCVSKTSVPVPDPKPQSGLDLRNCTVPWGDSGAPVLQIEDGNPSFSGTRIVAVARGGTQARLWPNLYPALAAMVESDAP